MEPPEAPKPQAAEATPTPAPVVSATPVEQATQAFNAQPDTARLENLQEAQVAAQAPATLTPEPSTGSGGVGGFIKKLFGK